MTLAFPNGAVFSVGLCRYKLKPAARGDTYLRPFLTISVEGKPVEVAVDTGGHFLILHPEIGRLLNLRRQDADVLDQKLLVRGERTSGHLHRVTMTMAAEQGEPCDVDVTALVPEGEWPYPNFLGWPCCLERLRFAFDPSPSDLVDGWFHFGPLDARATLGQWPY